MYLLQSSKRAITPSQPVCLTNHYNVSLLILWGYGFRSYEIFQISIKEKRLVAYTSTWNEHTENSSQEIGKGAITPMELLKSCNDMCMLISHQDTIPNIT